VRGSAVVRATAVRRAGPIRTGFRLVEPAMGAAGAGSRGALALGVSRLIRRSSPRRVRTPDREMSDPGSNLRSERRSRGRDSIMSTLTVDCDTCSVRGLACKVCVITVLFGAPPNVELDPFERRAPAVLP